MSSSTGSAASSSGGGQLGARPKTSRPKLQEPAKNRPANDDKWDSNWNSVLSAQEENKCHNGRNGQPPSTAAAASFHQQRQWPISRGASDPSLAQQQPVRLNNINSNNNRQKPLELFHSPHYHARRDRAAAASRSSSAADLSRSSSTTLSSNTSLNIKDSTSGGISSIWSRWFRRNNNRNQQQRQQQQQQPRAAAVVGVGSRSHSVENSPVVSRRRENNIMTGSSGGLAAISDSSDSLSTHSFAFIRAASTHNSELTLRRKYGLMDSESVCSIEGDAIRAMRTQWESQIKELENPFNSGQQRRSQASTGRKKRPAPPPPQMFQGLAHVSNQPSTRSSVASTVGFTHVPGKRKAPSPPIKKVNSQQSAAGTSALNIPPATTTTTTTPAAAEVSSSQKKSTSTEQKQKHPTAAKKQMLMEATAVVPQPDDKWTNDLNSNMDDKMAKTQLFRQKKVGDDCPHNDILKLEGGLLRPLDRHNSCKPAASDTTTPASTMDSMHRMTLPLKPWYKRGHPQNHPSIQHNTSNRHHQQTRSRWKDAALLNPLLPDDCWIGLPSPPATTANRQFSFNAPTSTGSTLTVSTSNTVSPPGSTKSGGSSNSSDGSKKRKSLLVNISQLDREAAEIIQRERARESHRKRLADERFYSGSPLEPVPDDEGVVANEIATKCTRELIDMFNSLSSTKMSSSVDLAINSQQLIAKTDSNANNKTTATAETQSSSSSSVSVTTPTTDATTMEVSSSAAAVTVTPICSSSSSSSESTITRLRVNQKTVPTTTTTASSGEQTITSIFNPKLEVVTSQQQRRPSIEYTGGARPKTNNNISVTELTESVDQQLVNGTPPKDLPPSSTPVLTPGWACHVCTLINSDARLWCEACTALKPRLLLNRPSVAVAAPSVTTKPTIKSKPESLKMSPDDSMMKKNAPLLASNETTKNRTTAPSGDGPSTPADCKVSEDNKENRPSSPEALRQARLAFFLSGNNQQQQKPSEPVVVEQPAAAAGGDKNNNNTKRHSQQNHVKVSSSSQTTAPIPSLIKIRPLSMLDTTDSVISNNNNDNNKNSSTSVSAETNNKIRIAVKDVTPTNFAVLSSPSRTQLSQYLQQRDQQQATTNNNNKAPNETDEQLNKDSTVVNEEKRVDVLLWRLEEAIAAGQFDKAAVLAKELAAIKKPSSVKPPDSPILLPAGNSTIVLKPVAAPRSIIPASIKPVASTPPLESPLKSSDVKDSANPAAVVPINNEVNLLPLPPKRSPPAVEPIPVPRTVRPQETAVADVEEKKPEIPNVTRKSVERESPGRNKIPDDKKTDPVPILPEVAVVKPKRTKVSSGQQTTLTYQRKPDDKRAVKERAQSCIIDDTFKVEVFIEDRSTHSGPFSWAIKPTTTLLEVKQKMEQEHHIPVLSQRWILGRRLADKDEMTLQQYDICPSNSSLFLYVLTEPIKRQTPPPKPNRSPPPPPLPTTKPPELNAKRYYNFEEDRYSTCEESDEGEAVDLRNDDKPTNNHQVNQVSITANPQPLAADEFPVANPPQTNQDQATPTVDYKKLLDLDQSDVVANADAFDCSVCMMNVPTGVGITLRECLHNFCRDCLAHVIEFSDEAAVTCPFRDDHYACDSVIQEREIKALVPPNIYERHLERSMRLAEKAMKNTFHCQTADCPGWAIIEDNVNVFRCPVCTKTNCLTCQAIHEGANCKQYQDRVNLNAETDEDAKRTKEMIEALVASGEALSCPQCQVVLMKRWGCDWVRCSVCRTEICWVTKQSRWGPKGKGDTSRGCRCGVGGVKCHPLCNYCH